MNIGHCVGRHVWSLMLLVQTLLKILHIYPLSHEFGATVIPFQDSAFNNPMSTSNGQILYGLFTLGGSHKAMKMLLENYFIYSNFLMLFEYSIYPYHDGPEFSVM